VHKEKPTARRVPLSYGMRGRGKNREKKSFHDDPESLCPLECISHRGKTALGATSSGVQGGGGVESGAGEVIIFMETWEREEKKVSKIIEKKGGR